LVQRSTVIFFLIWTFIAVSFASQIFVSTTGNDTTGTINRIDLPFQTIPKPISVAVAGDNIYMRGGVYNITAKISISNKGGVSSSNRCNLWAYPGETPILDFTTDLTTGDDGISLGGTYWYIKGINIKAAPHNGMKINGGSNNIIEMCSFYECKNTGFQLASNASNNQIINCDSYYNYDAPSGGNADGFSPKLTVGTGNYFYVCRSWQNSDDGYDGYLRQANDVITTYENCWAFMNGYLKDGNQIVTGNGNGFKTGGSDAKDLKHNAILKNCLAFDNRVKGFDQNNNCGSITLYNCTGYRNGTYNFSVPDTLAVSAGKILTVKNCISLDSPSGITLLDPILATNSWPNTPSYVTIATSADFVSIDTTGVRGPRKANGSLPDITFMHLAQGSQFIDAGTDVGLLFNGSAPDLGFFESDYPTSVSEEITSRTSNFQLLQNYPNPFNPTTTIRFSVANADIAKLHVVNILGQRVATLFSGHEEPGTSYPLQFNAASLPFGVYFSILESNGKQAVQKMILMK
jgi:hypothetical protein